jgi:hypothetical protein
MHRSIRVALAAVAVSSALGGRLAAQQGEDVGLASRNYTSAVRVIPSGTSVPVTLEKSVKVNESNIGHTFPGHVTRDVTLNGAVAIPAGTPAQVELAKSADQDNAATLHLRSVELNGQTQSVAGSDARMDTQRGGWSTGTRAAAGAVAGAVVGKVLGVGVLKGAALGAGGGLAWGLLDKNRVVKPNTPMMFQLQEDLHVQH